MDVIANIRIVEDSVAYILLSIAIGYLLQAVTRLKGVPLRLIPLSMLLGLTPFYFWKFVGMVRRVFIDKSTDPDLYRGLHDIGELFESLSGLAIALSFIYILVQIKRMTKR